MEKVKGVMEDRRAKGLARIFHFPFSIPYISILS